MIYFPPAQLKGLGALLFFFFFAIFYPVFMGPVVLALHLWRLSCYLSPKATAHILAKDTMQCVSLLSFYTFCFRMQDFLMVCLGFSKSLFTDPEKCQPHTLKNTGKVYMCLKICHHIQAHLMFGANLEADLIAVCSDPLFAKKVAVKTGQNLSSHEPLV